MAESYETILENAVTNPKAARNATESVEQHSIPDQIAADKHAASRRGTAAGTARRLSSIYAKIAPGSAVG